MEARTALESKILMALEGRTLPSMAITRSALVALTLCPDRANRDAIASLQSRGLQIVNFGSGYFLAGDDDWKRYKRREWRRIRTMAEKLRSFLPELAGKLDKVQLELGISE